MNELPRQTLSRIIAKYGQAICAAPKRIEALLRDLCGAHRREINIIMGALEERIATDLTAASSSSNAVPKDVLFARLAARLRDNLAYTPEAARWAVETWAVALGIISEAEARARAETESMEAGESDAPPPVRHQEPSKANQANINPPATEPQPGTTGRPSQQRPRPPQMDLPPGLRPSAQAPRQSPGPPQSAVVTELPWLDTLAPPLPSRRMSRRGLTLRGCVIMFVLAVLLIVAAVFVVPAVITILREEQAQPSINDPRIR